MLTAVFSSFWQPMPRTTDAPAPPRKRPFPVFIGDAVQPFAGETLLLSILRAEADTEAEDRA